MTDVFTSSSDFGICYPQMTFKQGLHLQQPDTLPKLITKQIGFLFVTVVHTVCSLQYPWMNWLLTVVHQRMLH